MKKGVYFSYIPETRASERLPTVSLFIVWAPRHRGTRSAWLARELGIDDIRYFAPTRGCGLRAALSKYPPQLVATLKALIRQRPRVLFVQSPPSFAAWTGAFYAAATGAALVVDAHSDAFERQIWTRPRWLTKRVARTAATTIVTNDHWAEVVRSWGGIAMAVPSLPTHLSVGSSPRLGPGFNVAVVNTWAADEPLIEVLAAADRLRQATFHVTGRDDRVAELDVAVPPNVRFTGFLPEDDYHALLAAADAVVCLTTRDHTMQNGASEALSLGTPIVTSDWPILRSYFSRGTVHVDNTAAGIEAGLRRLMECHADYRSGVRELAAERRREWELQRRQLIATVADRLRQGR
jgi:glycosyltransferase involved in cell wall biosynthesis